MRKIYTIGETVLDILFKNKLPFTAKAGGACLNTAVTLGRLNLPVYFIGEYGMDEVGNIIDQFLKDNHVSTQYVYRYYDGKSTLALAFLNENNDASKRQREAHTNLDEEEWMKRKSGAGWKKRGLNIGTWMKLSGI